MYITAAYEDTIFYRIIHRAKVNPKKEYRYSDVGYYFMKEIVERITDMPIEDYLQANFYGPLGMSRTTFNPMNKFSRAEIIQPRMTGLIESNWFGVMFHDPGAAMLGGVGGHAGLFSTTNDLAKLMQLYLNNGNYGRKAIPRCCSSEGVYPNVSFAKMILLKMEMK